MGMPKMHTFTAALLIALCACGGADAIGSSNAVDAEAGAVDAPAFEPDAHDGAPDAAPEADAVDAPDSCTKASVDTNYGCKSFEWMWRGCATPPNPLCEPFIGPDGVPMKGVFCCPY